MCIRDRGSPEQARPVIETLIGLSDVVKASDEDIAWLYPGEDIADVLRGWSALGPRVVAATRGGSDLLVLVGGELHQRPAARVVVIDTVGAGDSFMSGFISGLLDAGLLGGTDARERLAEATWEDIAPAVERAMACAAITVSRAGANPPTRAEL